MNAATPMMQQYRSIKRQHADAILFYRLGDFYEMFEGDAKIASSTLNLTLTKRHDIPMCGIPYHAAPAYIRRLLDAGLKIAVCEQIALPEGGRGIAERKVVQIITPGTIVDEEFLDNSSNNYLTAVGRGSRVVSIASVDLSTGELIATAVPVEMQTEGVRAEIQRLAPREVLLQESMVEQDADLHQLFTDGKEVMVNLFPDWDFDVETSREKMLSQFHVTNLKGFGIGEEDGDTIRSVGVLLDYVGHTQRGVLPHISDIKVYGDSDYVGLDETTQRNLELVRNLADGGKKHTLLQVLDHTRTSMGARMLKRWMLAPLRERADISTRADRVEIFYRNQLLLSSVRELLGAILDLERLTARISLDRAHAKNLLGVRDALTGSLAVRETIAEWIEIDEVTPEEVEVVSIVVDLLTRAIHPDPSVLLSEGRLIAEGFSAELDRIRAVKGGSNEMLDEYLEAEKRASGIANLKVRYNKIIGYFLEVTKSNLQSVPDHFIRRQSLVGSERYTTERLVELEIELNTSTETIIELERRLFLEVRDTVKREVVVLKRLATSVAGIDCIQALAYAATIHGFAKPQIDDTTSISISGGRHPVVEMNLPSGTFVPNDTVLGRGEVFFSLITGPNMAGKSTYLRQVALIVLMAQIGSFVPADEAQIGIVDRIFCRVGAQDNLARGESTFLVEMTETAHILRSLTSRSLIIMDEVGRGTGTNDGLAIAWAVTEHLLEATVKTLFATHFHELTTIQHSRKIDLVLEVRERDNDIVFLKRVRPGKADHSYGVHVARLAGIPKSVVDRAREILYDLLHSDTSRDRERPMPPPTESGLFEERELIESEIQSVDITQTTPLDALLLIKHWQDRLAGN